MKIKKAKQMLGFIYRNSISFSKPETLQILYYSYVRSHLEYASLIWSPSSVEFEKKLENIQDKFLRFLYKKQFQYYPNDIHYNDLLLGYEIQSLTFRRKLSNLIYIINLITAKIDNPLQLSEIKFIVPRPSQRVYTPFYIPHFRTQAYKNSPLVKTLTHLNEIYKQNPAIDLLNRTVNPNSIITTLGSLCL